MKIAIVIGTRPEIIKMSPIIGFCQKKGLEHIIIHSNQHYSHEMDSLIFEDLGIRKPDFNLEVGSGTQGQQTARILERIESVFLKEKPDYVLVHGDVNTTLGAALAARKLCIKIGHVEAGLRSYDNRMPEEVNRVLVDHMTDHCFAPTINSANNLKKEGILGEKIFIVGNTVVDSCLNVMRREKDISYLLKANDLLNQEFILLTLHRQENTDHPERFNNIVRGIIKVSQKSGMKILFPVHPRTEKVIKENELVMSENFILRSPFGYVDFIRLMQTAKLILTDSGGIQEEACILRTPCVTIRENTERPESVEVGANIIAGIDPETILSCSMEMLKREKNWNNPFGDGKTTEKIMAVVNGKIEE